MATDTAEIRFFVLCAHKGLEGENVFTSIKRTPVGKISSVVAFECVKTHPESLKPAEKACTKGRCESVHTL